MSIKRIGPCVIVAIALFGGVLARDGAGQPVRRRVIRPEKGPNTGLPFSPGILAGNTLYISGHLGRDPATNALVRGGIEAETRQSLANIREVLKGAGMDFKDGPGFAVLAGKGVPSGELLLDSTCAVVQ